MVMLRLQVDTAMAAFVKSLKEASLLLISIFALGCVTHPLDYSGDRFEVVKEQNGHIIEKTELADTSESKIVLTEIQAPLGIPSPFPSYWFPSGIAKSGNTFAYIINFSEGDKIRVLSKFPGFQVGDCVQVLFGKSEVRMVYSDGCQ